MDTLFMNSKNSKIFNGHRLLLNLSDKIDLKRSDKYIALSNLSINIHGKIYTKMINLKYQLEHEMKKSKICYTTKAMFIFINKLSFHTGNIIKLQ